MPELPDLLYITDYLRKEIADRTITGVEIRQPVVFRSVGGTSADAIVGRKIEGIGFRGPFLHFWFTGSLNLIVNLMLAGVVQHQKPREKRAGYCCLSLPLDDGSHVHICDQKLMAKVYLAADAGVDDVPGFRHQGVDILSDHFTISRFAELLRSHGRKQVRVFLRDRSILSAIGNAYADEILFEAGIHPKTFAGRLSPEDRSRLFESIRKTMEWGAAEVRKACQPIQVKVRDHMKVRNRKGKPCPRCGTTIRREGVRGADVYFCPTCQPATRKLFIDWTKRP